MPNKLDGLCHCGCGQKTTIARKTNTAKGWIKGQPISYIQYHNMRLHPLRKCTNWKGDAVGESAARLRAHRLYRNIGPCTMCGNLKSERHHKDGNPRNNNSENIQILCHYHHMEVDGRLKQVAGFAAKRKETHICAGRGEQWPIRCETCGQYISYETGKQVGGNACA